MKKIDIESWDRKDIYRSFLSVDKPFSSFTVPIDVTKLKKFTKEKGLSFYFSFMWVCTKAANSIPNFNMRIRNDEVYLLDQTIPSYTFLKKDSTAYMIGQTPWFDDISEFCRYSNEVVNTQAEFLGGKDETDDLIYISCTPWFDFSAFSSFYRNDDNDTIPRFTWGKYLEEGEKLILHLAIEVNHRTVDGYHIGLFVNEINNIMQNEL